MANVGLKHPVDRDPSTITVFVGWLSHHLLLNQTNKEETPMEMFVEPIELNDAELAVARIFTSREVAIHSGDVERVGRGKFSSIVKRIAFLVVYTVAVSSASIA